MQWRRAHGDCGGGQAERPGEGGHGGDGAPQRRPRQARAGHQQPGLLD